MHDFLKVSVYTISQMRDYPNLCKVPLYLSKEIDKGVAVRVSIGGKDTLGYVVDLPTNSGDRVTGEVLQVYDLNQGGLSGSLVDLGMWISDYYITYPIRAFQAMLPKLAKVLPKEVVTLCDFSLLSEKETIVKTKIRKEIVSNLSNQGPLTVRQLERKLNSKAIRETLHVMEKAGLVKVEKQYVVPKLKTQYGYRLSISEEEVKKMLGTLRGKRMQEVLERALKFNGRVFFKEEIKGDRRVLNALSKKGLLTRSLAYVKKAYKNTYVDQKHIASLSMDQKSVCQVIESQLEKEEFGTFLLYGVTGSGKTAVYIEIVRKVLQRGKTAIILVPEVSLTPQTSSRFQNVFGDTVRIVHSNMSDRERYEAWRSLNLGEAKIAIGVRSSIFSPLKNIGVIVVDEEHDPSYKQDTSPTYHARDCAVMRAKLEGAVCVLASATPSFESFYNARNNKYTLLNLPNRVIGQPPEIKVVSFSESEKVTNTLTTVLHHEIERRLMKSEQVILLQNRRGFSSFQQCKDCGHTNQCKNCYVTLTYHQGEELLKCHYCGYKREWGDRCVYCQSKNVKLMSPGTEQIHGSLERLFPEHKTLRMDRDVTLSKNSHARILEKFQKHKADILLGTQMVAKGIDFSNVTLVAVINADIGLTFPDFRASERVFSLLVQVAGRSGRGDKNGEVFFQTHSRKHPVLRYASAQDYQGFYDFESETRKMLYFPPFSKLLKISFSGKQNDITLEVSQETSAFLSHLLNKKDFEVTDSVPSLILKTKGSYRYHLLVKQKHNKRVTKRIWRQTARALRHTWTKKKIKVSIDVDTQSVM